MELLDVHHDGVHVELRMVLIQAVGVFQEEVSAVEHGQTVVLRRGNKLSPLAQLDDPPHPGQDHLMHIKGLCDEVGGPHLQGPELGAFVGSQDDDGDILHLLVALHPLHYLKPIHHRHHEIKYDDGQLREMLFDLLQSFHAVGCIDDFVVVLKDHA